MNRKFPNDRLPMPPQAALDYEIIQEQATALGRHGRALEAALAKLRDFDASHLRAGLQPAEREVRAVLAARAGEALWMFVVQREACGLRDSRTVMREYKVPPEVQLRMGLLGP